jgi:hypothetical protein
MRERYHLKDQLVKLPRVHASTNVKRKFYARMTQGCPFEVRRRQPLLQPAIRRGGALPRMGVEHRWGREVAAG